MSRVSAKRSESRGRHVQSWEDWAQVDPHYAVVSDPNCWDGAWANLGDEFVRSGTAEVDTLVESCRRLGLSEHWGRALDFGSGLGRVTQALAIRSQCVLGVDVSPTMVAEATRLHGHLRNIEFRTIDGLADLSSERFDLIWSILVLQHLGSSEAIRGALADLSSLLDAGGIMVVEIPHAVAAPSLRGRLRLRTRLFRACRIVGLPPAFLRRRLRLYPLMTMHALDEQAAVDTLTSNGLDVLQVGRHTGTDGVDYRRYMATRRLR